MTEKLTPRQFGPLGPVEVARYAGASGDFNPLHLDRSAAQAAGFDEIFIMGLLPASILASYVSDHVGVEHIRSFAVRYHRQVWLGDVIMCSGEIEVDGDGVRRVTAQCSTEREGVVLTATAVAAADPSRSSTAATHN
jgi:acyl dehydratase